MFKKNKSKCERNYFNMKNQFNLLVGQSGGPTTVINSSLAGVIKAALDSPDISTIYGMVNGIQGVLKEEFVNLTSIFQDNPTDLETLKTTPSMYLGSCRYKLPEVTENSGDYEQIFEVFSRLQIKYFLYIGGNDSMDTVDKLSRYAKMINYDIKILGIPKTIDNDLMEIDHTPGFGSAAKYIASSMLEIAHDTYIYDIPSVVIVEIMGRNAGWLTAASALARTEYSQAPHLIYLPETPFSTSKFVQDVKDQLFHRKQVIVAVSEGIKDITGSYISAQASRIDQFGHVMLSGTGKYLESLLIDTIGCKVRSIEFNVLQRCAAHILSKTDVEESFLLGVNSVSFALAGHSSEMVLLRRTANTPYTVEYDTAPISSIANLEKKIPSEWITESKNDITDDFMDYLIPLVEGEVSLTYKNGIPLYLSLKNAQID